MTSRNPNIKIFFVYNTSWYLYNFRLPLIKDLMGKRCTVYALAPADSYVKKLKENGIEHVDIKMSRSGLNPLKDIILVLKFISIFKKYKPDIIQGFTIKPNIYGTIAAKIARVRYIYNMITGLGYVFIGNGLRKKILRILTLLMYRVALMFSNHVYFQNKDDKEYFIEHKVVKKQRISVVPGSGVDTKYFNPAGKTKHEKVTFIFVGRMLWDKGVGEYVQASKMLSQIHKNARFWLLGPIDHENPKAISRAQLESWSGEGIAEYLGRSDNVRSYLEKADVIVLPSYREGIPLSLLEGAAMGMPIITTDTVGCRETVEDGKNGFLVPVMDAGKLMKAMEKFIVNPYNIDIMGRESRKMAVDKYDVKKVNKEILYYYPLQHLIA